MSEQELVFWWSRATAEAVQRADLAYPVRDHDWSRWFERKRDALYRAYTKP